jgi:hypothetical protein
MLHSVIYAKDSHTIHPGVFMLYPLIAFISVIIFALVHIWAEKVRTMHVLSQGRFLSLGGGVAVAYVFVDLLPKLGKSNAFVERVLAGFFPYFERHVFVMALLGFLLFFLVDRSASKVFKDQKFILSMCSYALFNFLVGYAVVDKDDPEVQPLALFTIAIALHYFTNDYSLCESHGKAYRKTGRWLLIASLFLGWLVGLTFQLSETAVALIGAFIGGGVIMNVTRHELPEEKPNSVGAFLLSAAIYTAILLCVHS